MNQRDRYIMQTVKASSWLASVKRANQTLVAIEPYIYNGVISNVADGATGQVAIPVQSDSDFVCLEMSGAVVDLTSGAFVPNPLATVQVTDSGTGKTFFLSDTLFALVFGIAGYPYFLASPRVISPNTNLIVNFANNSGGGHAYTAYIVFAGARLYYAS